MTKERRYKEYNIYGQCYYLKSMIKVVPLHDNMLCGEEREITSVMEITDKEFILSEFKFVQYIDDVYDKLIKTITTSDPDYWQLKNLRNGSEIIIEGKKHVIKEVINNNIYLFDQFDEDVDKESFEKADKLFNEIRDKVNSINNISAKRPSMRKPPSFLQAINIETDLDKSIEEQLEGMTQEEVMEIYDQILSEAEIDEDILHLSPTMEEWLHEIYNSKQYKDAVEDNLKKNSEMEKLYEAEKDKLNLSPYITPDGYELIWGNHDIHNKEKITKNKKENKFIKFIKKMFRRR